MKRLFLFPRANRRNRGTILIVAVGTIVVLSILAVGAGSSVSQELRLSAFLTDSNTSFYYGLSAVRAMKAYWQFASSPLVTTFYELRPRPLDFGERTVEAVFSDEEALVNISRSPSEILLRIPGIDGNEALVQEILASPAALKEDLLRLNGMDPEIYATLKDLVTVYGDGKVNINTATPQTLSILGCGEPLVRKIAEFRAGEDALEGTEDDNVFNDVNVIPTLLQPYGLTASEKIFLEGLIFAQRLKTYSGNIRFEMAVKQGNKTLRTIRAVVDLASGQIKRWDEE
ncbi:MAG: hypothetical protein WC732_07315 [Candidatus Omnitrophota bacterium]